DLGGGEGGIDRDVDGSRAQGGHVGVRPLGTVLREQGYPVAALHAEAAQPEARLLDRPAEVVRADRSPLPAALLLQVLALPEGLPRRVDQVAQRAGLAQRSLPAATARRGGRISRAGRVPPAPRRKRSTTGPARACRSYCFPLRIHEVTISSRTPKNALVAIFTGRSARRLPSRCPCSITSAMRAK